MQNQIPSQILPQTHNYSTNPSLNQNPPLNQAQNLNQGSMVATIQAEPKIKDVDIGVFTHVAMTMGEDGPH